MEDERKDDESDTSEKRVALSGGSLQVFSIIPGTTAVQLEFTRLIETQSQPEDTLEDEDEKPHTNKDETPHKDEDEKPHKDEDEKPRMDEGEKPYKDEDEKPHKDEDEKPHKDEEKDEVEGDNEEPIENTVQEATEDIPSYILQGPMLDVGQILSETLDIVKQYDKFSFKHKMNLQKKVYMLNSILEALSQYEGHMERLSRFLINNDSLQTECYSKYCECLPPYGDYLRVLEADSEEKVTVLDCPTPVAETELYALVDSIVKNLFAEGMQIRMQHALCKNINTDLELRQNVVQGLRASSDDWFFLLSKIYENQDIVRKMLFGITNQVRLLGMDESEPPLKLDMYKALHSKETLDDFDENIP